MTQGETPTVKTAMPYILAPAAAADAFRQVLEKEAECLAAEPPALAPELIAEAARNVVPWKDTTMAAVKATIGQLTKGPDDDAA